LNVRSAGLSDETVKIIDKIVAEGIRQGEGEIAWKPAREAFVYLSF